MIDESAVWDKSAEKYLEEKETFPFQEIHSESEDIQNRILNLISELNTLKEKYLEQEPSDKESQKILEFIEKTRQEIFKLK